MNKNPLKTRLLPALSLLALTVILSACGGYTTVDLGGSASGVTRDGLVLVNAGKTVAVPVNATSYTFPEKIDIGSQYNVSIQAQPGSLTCALSNTSGTASGQPISNVNVACTTNTHTLGGTVSGLTTTGLALTNGSDTVTIAAGQTSFVFSGKVADGTVYGVAILTQPAGQTCSVQNGTAVMGSADVTNVAVSCV
ncbi:hypothetical protein ACFQAT_13075 [Undibacterium arcticum]|uniref:Uncharacterized protein n=1 Tax=Undibacterium arcticum TaxID=1762892 RepID=A0ABV7FAM4_9BURK